MRAGRERGSSSLLIVGVVLALAVLLPGAFAAGLGGFIGELWVATLAAIARLLGG